MPGYCLVRCDFILVLGEFVVRIGVIGSGYIGLVGGAGFAASGEVTSAGLGASRSPHRDGGSAVAECELVGRPASPGANTRADHLSLQSGLVLSSTEEGRPSYDELGGRTFELALKRLIDIVLSSGALMLFSLVFLATAVAIKMTSRGPVFFRQVRPGFRGVPFPLYKFRTMLVDKGDASGVTQTVANDPRVTPIGAFLRRTSLDELPQLVNVLLGQMSLVGPRPHPAGMSAGGVDYRELVPYYEMRYAVKPGLSGWAQANGYRGPTDDAAKAKARIDHDIAYIQNFSIFLDAQIILRTLRREFVCGSGI